MELGGRRAVYELMGMKPPVLKGPPPKREAKKIVIDRTGEGDKARYSGLKMGLGMDDNAMAEALAKANRKAKEGKDMREKIAEETYEQPFSGKHRPPSDRQKSIPFLFAAINNHSWFSFDALSLSSLSFFVHKTRETQGPDRLLIGRLKILMKLQECKDKLSPGHDDHGRVEW